MTYIFDDDLRESLEDKYKIIWWEFYKKTFPSLLRFKRVSSKEENIKGYDRILCVGKHNKIILIEEKEDKYKTGNFFLEYISNDSTRSPGWICKPLKAEYIAYYFINYNKHYLFDTRLLQYVWIVNNEDWKYKYGIKIVPNIDYNTLGVAVPINKVLQEVNMFGHQKSVPTQLSFVFCE